MWRTVMRSVSLTSWMVWYGIGMASCHGNDTSFQSNSVVLVPSSFFSIVKIQERRGWGELVASLKLYEGRKRHVAFSYTVDPIPGWRLLASDRTHQLSPCWPISVWQYSPITDLSIHRCTVTHYSLMPATHTWLPQTGIPTDGKFPTVMVWGDTPRPRPGSDQSGADL